MSQAVRVPCMNTNTVRLRYICDVLLGNLQVAQRNVDADTVIEAKVFYQPARDQAVGSSDVEQPMRCRVFERLQVPDQYLRSANNAILKQSVCFSFGNVFCHYINLPRCLLGSDCPSRARTRASS